MARKVPHCISLVVSIGVAILLQSCGEKTALTSLPLPPQPVAVSSTPASFNGRYLMALSDADMLPSAYVDGQLGDRNQQDTLTVLSLLNTPPSPIEQVLVSNAVTAWPLSFTVSPDGRSAYVIETSEPAPNNAETLDQLPMGRKVRSLDLSNPSNAKVVDELEIGYRPEAIALHPKGNLLAVTTSREPGKQIHLIPTQNAQFGQSQSFPVVGTAGRGEVGGIRWHPSGRFLAVTIMTRNEIAFYQVEQDTQGKYQFRVWGQPIQVGKFPVSGQFTPDGKFFVANSVHWGLDVDGFFVGAPPGSLTSIRFDGDRAQHQIISQAPTGISPEGMAMSPDGRLIATSNLVRSSLPKSDPRLTAYSSVSLTRLDAATGQLQTGTESRLEGQVLPQGIVFDATGQNLAVTSFVDTGEKSGSIHFFRVVPDTLELEQTGSSVNVVRGPHQLVLVP